MHHHYQAGAHFREMQREYMRKVYQHQGGCPEVMTPDSGTLPNYPHLWSTLQATVEYVGAPLWMLGKTPIMVGARNLDTHALSARTPPEYEARATQYGEVQTIRVPRAVHKAMAKCGYHHVGDYVDHMGELCMTQYTIRRRVGTVSAAGWLYTWL